jgi:hypothetical protein
MNRFISTRLFLALRDASQNGIDVDAKVLQNGYDEFVESVFQGKTAFRDKAAYHDALVYTRVELTTLPGLPGKKIRQFICIKPLNSLMRKSHGWKDSC